MIFSTPAGPVLNTTNRATMKTMPCAQEIHAVGNTYRSPQIVQLLCLQIGVLHKVDHCSRAASVLHHASVWSVPSSTSDRVNQRQITNDNETIAWYHSGCFRIVYHGGLCCTHTHTCAVQPGRHWVVMHCLLAWQFGRGTDRSLNI